MRIGVQKCEEDERRILECERQSEKVNEKDERRDSIAEIIINSKHDRALTRLDFAAARPPSNRKTTVLCRVSLLGNLSF